MSRKPLFDFDNELNTPTYFDRKREEKRLSSIAPAVDIPEAFQLSKDVHPDGNIIAPNLEDAEVRNQAAQEAQNLMQKIVDSQMKLEKMQKDVEKAKNIPNNFLNRKKIEEQRRINEENFSQILREQNELISGNILLTIRTIEFASYLGQELGQLIENGFRTRDGHIQRVSGQTRQLAESLLKQVNGHVFQLKSASKDE